jgi:hypothetical protein
MKGHGKKLPVMNEVDGRAWENSTGNAGKKLPAHGKILPKNGKIVPPNKVLRRSLIRF